MENLSIAINKLGPAAAEKGITPAKLALLAAARDALQLSIADDTLTAGALALVKSALTNVIFAIDCANNNMSGSGRAVPVSSTEKKLNEPFHTQKAFDEALAALSA